MPRSVYRLNSEPLASSGTLEVRRQLLPAGVHEQTERDWNVKVDPEDVGFNGGAQAYGSFEIDKASEERAARGVRWGPDHGVHRTVEDLSAHP